MSRSNNQTIVNPCTLWLKWSGSEGKIMTYNKETQQNEEIAMPFKFLLLEELHTVTGYNEPEKKGIYSNEVVDLKNQSLSVKMDKTVIASGTYEKIKDAVKAKSGKYAKSCYIAYKGKDGKLEIGNFLFTGSSFSGGKYKEGKEEKEIEGWMGFTSRNRAQLYEKTITVTCHEQECTKGATKYRVPKFTLTESTEKTNEEAKQLDILLQAYLTAYYAKTQSKEALAETVVTEHRPETQENGSDPWEFDESQLPF